MREIHESVPRQGVNENLNRQQYHTQTKCVRKRLSKTEENKNKKFYHELFKANGEGTKTEKRTTDLYYFTVLFGTLFTQREVDKSSSLLM